jgi:hypothetical protein
MIMLLWFSRVNWRRPTLFCSFFGLFLSSSDTVVIKTLYVGEANSEAVVPIAQYNPTNVDKNTRAERSLLVTIPTRPVTQAANAIPAPTIVKVTARAVL